ncbi:hypothetical protein, partial [Clostridium botulinum]|uniref:hypothetical protein n=1 Tax=Clostridium botulinum TaxID=1491 RepID=UPI001A9A3156
NIIFGGKIVSKNQVFLDILLACVLPLFGFIWIFKILIKIFKREYHWINFIWVLFSLFLQYYFITYLIFHFAEYN